MAQVLLKSSSTKGKLAWYSWVQAMRALDRSKQTVPSSDKIAIVDVVDHYDHVMLTWNDQLASRFEATWLRHNCTCVSCMDPNSGQRLIDITDLPETVRVADASIDDLGNQLSLAFAPDDHRSCYDSAWLYAFARGAAAPLELWGAELSGGLPEAEYETVLGDRRALARWLAYVRSHGFALLRQVPVVDGEIARVAELFGFIRETNYGRLFDVITQPNPSNLAYSGEPLGVHTDNPYRDPVPGLQLLHCLKASQDGGRTVLVDGFRAGARLRDESPDDFSLLSTWPVPFEFCDSDVSLKAYGRIIDTDGLGRIVGIRYNTRSVAAFDLPPELMPVFYDAYRRFAQALRQPDLELEFALEPGDLLIVDNRRVLHGRRGVADGKRHLQGCYADRDALDSFVRMAGI